MFSSLLHTALNVAIWWWSFLHPVQILPLIQKYKVLHLNRTDARLANNGLPLEIQRLRCRVNYAALKFTPQIEELGKRVIRILRQNGPFLVLHLRYEMDMLAFSGCTQGCTPKEAEELTRMRYAYHLFQSLGSRHFWCLCTAFFRIQTMKLLKLQVRLPMVERESNKFFCEKKRRPLPFDARGDCSCP